LINRFSEAKLLNKKSITLLGDGSPVREFLHSDDLAMAVSRVVNDNLYQKNILNVAGGESITISKLANLIKSVTGFSGEILFSSNEKNGTSVKLIDGSELREYGWKPLISLEQGIKKAFRARNTSKF
jgi:GDP-L-fucose synthase